MSTSPEQKGPTPPQIPDPTPPEDAGQSSEQHHSRPRKRVDWHLPTSDTIVPARDHPEIRVPDTEQEDALRRDVRQLFSDQPHGQPVVPRIDVPAGPSNPGTSTPGRPKPVLRSGTATPQRAPSPPAEDLESGIQNLEGKSRSASHARERAHRLSKTLDTDETHQHPSGFFSRWAHTARHRFNSSTDKAYLPLYHDGGEAIHSGQVTPENGDDLDYVPKPLRYRAAGLSAQMLLSSISPGASRRGSVDDSLSSTPGSVTPTHSPPPETNFGRRTLQIPQTDSRPTSSDGLSPSAAAKKHRKRPSFTRFSSADHIDWRPGGGSPMEGGSTVSLLDNFSKYANATIKSAPKTSSQRRKSKGIMDISIKKHIEENRLRQQYLLKLARCLMEYGAPSHRIEDYMKMSARVLETEAQFLYMPNCMIISFDDSATHTTEVKMVKCNQGVDLGKLRDVHNVYKEVVHDNIGVSEAIDQLSKIIDRPKKIRLAVLVLVHGLASATVGPFAFQARWIDLPMAFVLGCTVGFMRLVWASWSDLYSSIFEVLAVILTSFCSRALGSIWYNYGAGERLFCFSALAQSSIALILPGYIILCGALELQSHNILAGAVRVFYAVIYSFFIGFGLTIGTVIYGAMDKNAVVMSNCSKPLDGGWNFLFVPLYTFTLMVLNQAKFVQMPVMLIISMIGYTVSYFSSQRFGPIPAVSSALAALAVSVSANVYSRLGGWAEPHINKFFDRLTEKYGKRFKKSAKNGDVPLETFASSNQAEAGQAGPSEKSRETSDNSAGSADQSGASQVTLVDADTQNTTPEGEKAKDENQKGSENSNATESTKSDKTKAKKVNYALAAAAMLPAIMVLVPSGLSVSGSLVSGVQVANEILHSANGTSSSSAAQTANNSEVYTVAYSVIQIAIGLTVGLFVGALIVYPYGKGGKNSTSRSGLFTF